MNGDELRKIILNELWWRFDQLGPDAMQDVQDQLGLPAEFFKSWRLGKTKVDIVQLGDVLAAMGVRPIEFFEMAFPRRWVYPPVESPRTQFVKDLRALEEEEG